MGVATYTYSQLPKEIARYLGVTVDREQMFRQKEKGFLLYLVFSMF